MGNIKTAIKKISGNRVKLGFNAGDRDLIKKRKLDNKRDYRD